MSVAAEMPAVPRSASPAPEPDAPAEPASPPVSPPGSPASASAQPGRSAGAPPATRPRNPPRLPIPIRRRSSGLTNQYIEAQEAQRSDAQKDITATLFPSAPRRGLRPPGDAEDAAPRARSFSPPTAAPRSPPPPAPRPSTPTTVAAPARAAGSPAPAAHVRLPPSVRLSPLPRTLPPLRLEDYDIDPVTGFVPSDPPLLARLPPYYEPWERIVDVLTGPKETVRKMVDEELPVLRTDGLRTRREWQRAYTVLAYIVHAYVWGDEGYEAMSLPPQLSLPLVRVSQSLGLRPSLSMYSANHYNWRPLDPTKPPSLDNIWTQVAFTDLDDEAWFNLVSISIELKGAEVLPLLLEQAGGAGPTSPEDLEGVLRRLAGTIDEMTALLGRMRERCRPEVFWKGFRRFLAGWEGVNVGRGMFYEGGREAGARQAESVGGGEAAQSPTIQAMDIFLGVDHRPTGMTSSGAPPSMAHGYISPLSSARHPPEAAGQPHNPLQSTTPIPDAMTKAKPKNFLLEMRNQMPTPTRLFLRDFTLRCRGAAPAGDRDAPGLVRAYVLSHPDHPGLAEAYNLACAAMRRFRERHMGLAHSYIAVMSRQEGRAGGSGSVGTGGSEMMPFLKQSKAETVERMVPGVAVEGPKVGKAEDEFD
ncbi:Indoleamine 2,3-dioxygenase-domain-containing protein [Hyaloraphidium curvatum]|nr:Indoleamine 2,3-dioxygenase-domain-containing protein [Hyaloraphidium curvatum]